jgi:glutathione S-transferase
LVGVSLDIVTLDEDQRVSKEQKAMNPSGKYPLLETKEGSLSGVVPIVKYLCKKGKKLMGDNSAVTQAKIDQWCFWTVSSLQPTC